MLDSILSGSLTATLLYLSRQESSFRDFMGIWVPEQVGAWRPVVDAVHAKGALIFCQIWHVGRVSTFELQPGGAAPLSSTEKGVGPQMSFDGHREEFSPPRRLTVEEIPAIVDDFRKAARNAIDAGTYHVYMLLISPTRQACLF